MSTRRIHLPALALAVFGIGLDAAVGREPSVVVEDIRELTAVIEEVTVNGADEAAEHRANNARFEADMAAFAKTVRTRYRDAVRNRLERSVRGVPPDAACIRG